MKASSPWFPLNSYIFIISIIFFFLIHLLLIEVSPASQGQRMKAQEDEDGRQCWVSNGSGGNTKIKGREEGISRHLLYSVSGLLSGSNVPLKG